MENLTNSAEEVLIDSLSFKLPSSGQYGTGRRSCTFHTEGSNSYSASAGTKVIRFRLAGDGQWLDPSTCRIMFDVVNAADTPDVKRLRPIGKAHGFFRRLRISVRGKSSKTSITTTVFLKCFIFYKPNTAVQTIRSKSLVIM
jgi:hypothetical protein